MKAQTGKRRARVLVLSPSVRELKSHRDLFISLGLFGSLCIHSLLFSPSPPLTSPLPCSFLFSDTPPPPVLFALRAACQGEHPILSALLSPALPPKSLSSPLASCLPSMSFLAWLCLSLKSTLLFFLHEIPSFFASRHFNFDTELQDQNLLCNTNSTV